MLLLFQQSWDLIVRSLKMRLQDSVCTEPERARRVKPWNTIWQHSAPPLQFSASPTPAPSECHPCLHELVWTFWPIWYQASCVGPVPGASLFPEVLHLILVHQIGIKFIEYRSYNCFGSSYLRRRHQKRGLEDSENDHGSLQNGKAPPPTQKQAFAKVADWPWPCCLWWRILVGNVCNSFPIVSFQFALSQCHPTRIHLIDLIYPSSPS